MARNGHGISAVAIEPNTELYDSLSQDGQDQWDSIGAAGYEPEKGAAGLWFARKPGDLPKDAIGPSESLSALVSMVKLYVAAHAPVAEPIDLTLDPSDRLPGMEEPAIEELDRLGDDCIFAKEKRDKAKTEFADSCDVMRNKMRDHGRKRYNRKGFSLVIEDSEKLVIKKAEQPKPPKNPKAKQPSLAGV